MGNIIQLKADKIVIVFIKLEEREEKTFIDRNIPPPYGYHHILKVYSNGIYQTVATIDCSTFHTQETVMEIAKIMAKSLGIETIEENPDFFKRKLANY